MLSNEMVSHEDLQRSLGRVEGNQDGFRERMDRFEQLLDKGFSEMREAHGEMMKRLAVIEDKESERRGAWKVIVAVSSFVAAIVAALVAGLLKTFLR